MELYNIFEELILEEVGRTKLLEAIDKRKTIRIYYKSPVDDDDPIVEGVRNIEPCVYGLHYKSGNPVLRAYQINGVSKTKQTGKGDLPGWRLFRLDGILSWTDTPRVFWTPRELYNPDGDAHINPIYAQVNFE